MRIFYFDIFRWFHNDIELNLSEKNLDLKYRISSLNSLLLLHTSRNDYGKYRCLGINEAGEDSIDLHLHINGKYSCRCFFLIITLSFLFSFFFFYFISSS